jgi:putative resolvase
MVEAPFYRVTQFASLVGRSVETVRTWDRQGKLRAEKTLTGERIYRPHHIDLAKALIKKTAAARN